jgi:hypothetical protein
MGLNVCLGRLSEVTNFQQQQHHHRSSDYDIRLTAQSTGMIIGETSPNDRSQYTLHLVRRLQATNFDDIKSPREFGGIAHLHGNIQLQLFVLQLCTNFTDESLELEHGVVELLRQGPKAERLQQVAHHCNRIHACTRSEWICRTHQLAHCVYTPCRTVAKRHIIYLSPNRQSVAGLSRPGRIPTLPR